MAESDSDKAPLLEINDQEETAQENEDVVDNPVLGLYLLLV